MKFVASLKWIPYCEGGRKKPPLVGSLYSPVITWNACEKNELWSIVFTCPEADDNGIIIEFMFLSPNAPLNTLCEGMAFKLLEGEKSVAIGSIISVL